MKEFYINYIYLPEVLQKEILSYGDPDLYKKYKIVMNELNEYCLGLFEMVGYYCCKCLIGLIRYGYICEDKETFNKCYSINNSLYLMKVYKNYKLTV